MKDNEVYAGGRYNDKFGTLGEDNSLVTGIMDLTRRQPVLPRLTMHPQMIRKEKLNPI